jgi:hypothetical protein
MKKSGNLMYVACPSAVRTNNLNFLNTKNLEAMHRCPPYI